MTQGTYGKGNSPNELAFVEPDYVKIYNIDLEYDFDAVKARWWWIPEGTLRHMVSWGGQMVRAQTGEVSTRKRRTITPEQEEEIIAAADAAGMVSGVGVPWGVSDHLVRTLFRERGRDFPKKTYERRAAEQRDRREARKAESMSMPPVSIRGPRPAAANIPEKQQAPKRWGKERKVPADEVIRADREAGMSTSDMAARYGVTGPCVYSHLKRLNLLTGVQVAETSILPKASPASANPSPLSEDAPVPAAHVVDSALSGAANPIEPPISTRTSSSRTADEADLDFMILAARICTGAKCSPMTAVGIVSAWRAMR